MASGERFFEQREFAQARVEFRRAVQADEASGEARLRLAESMLELGDLVNGMTEYHRAADLLPQRTDVQLKAGGFLLLQKRFEDARARAFVIIGREPRNSDAQVLLANSLAGMKDLDEAVSEMEQALALDPERAASDAKLREPQLASRNTAAAESAFLKAVELAPHSTRARLSLAVYHWALDRRVEAERELREAVARSPKNVVANRALILFLVGSGKAAETGPYLNVLAELSKDPAEKLTLVDYYVAAGRFSDATEVLESLAADKGTAVPAQLRLAALEARR